MGIFSRFRKKSFDDYDEDEYEVEGETVDVEAKASLEGSSSLELKIFKPQTMDQLLPAVDHLRAGKTVLLNLEGIDNKLYSKMIHFISGAAYALNVSIKKATDHSYCIAPSGVDVSGEAFENSNDDEDKFFDI